MKNSKNRFFPSLLDSWGPTVVGYFQSCKSYRSNSYKAGRKEVPSSEISDIYSSTGYVRVHPLAFGQGLCVNFVRRLNPKSSFCMQTEERKTVYITCIGPPESAIPCEPYCQPKIHHQTTCSKNVRLTLLEVRLERQDLDFRTLHRPCASDEAESRHISPRQSHCNRLLFW